MTRLCLRLAAFAFALGVSLPAFAAAWTDASGTILTAGTAQTITTSVTHGYMVCSNFGTMWVDDVNTANYVKSIPVQQGQCVTFPVSTSLNSTTTGTSALTIISPNAGAGFVARYW